MSVKIFVSAVSDEFRAYRDQLRSDLTRHNVEVKVQEDFKDYGSSTLDKLNLYIWKLRCRRSLGGRHDGVRAAASIGRSFHCPISGHHPEAVATE